ncbi:MAG: hypothetical protein VX044_05770 [Planctomycetota bacterium]|nr:hypothetical protein [Planctomycetota bacterium]
MRVRSARRLALAVGLAGSVAAWPRAQGLCWSVPRAGAVEYRRIERAQASAACRSRSLAEAAPLTEEVPRRLLPRSAPAPVLCWGELRDDRRALAGPVGDLRDLLRAVAFDLSSRAAKARAQRLLPLGDVRVVGAWGARDADGAQRLRAKLRVAAPARLAGEPAARLRRLEARCVTAAVGELRIARVVDAARGLVTGFHAECELLVCEGEQRWRRLQVADEWRLLAVRSNQDLDFRKRVAAAIERGAAWIRDAVAAERRFFRDRQGERNYGSGRLALALLAMLHGGVAVDDPVLAAGFLELQARRVDDAYSLATALMAAAAVAERRGLLDSERAVARGWLAALLRCTDPSVDPGDRLRFNYTRGPRYDTSLQQYGLLGMRAAQALELALPPRAFAAAARHLLAVQARDGDALRLQLYSDADLRSLPTGAPLPKVRAVRARARGFAYRERGDACYGAMTCAGVSGLLRARAGMSAQQSADRQLLRRVDEGVRDGFAWLAANFSVRINPGDPERADNHRRYYLYCLERCCELADVARLQGRDWYYEGGLQLLLAQRPDGSFQSGHPSTLALDSTCFALLFLSKASKQGPVTGG